MQKKLEQYRKASELVFRSGLQFGAILIIMNLIKFHFKLEGISIGVNSVLWVVGTLVYSYGIVYIIKKIRNDIYEGYIPFRRAFSLSTSMMFFAAGASAVASFVYFQWANPVYLGWKIETLFNLLTDYVNAVPNSEQMQELVQNMYKDTKVPDALGGAYSQFISNISLAFVIGLVASAVLKRKPQNNEISK